MGARSTIARISDSPVEASVAAHRAANAIAIVKNRSVIFFDMESPRSSRCGFLFLFPKGCSAQGADAVARRRGNKGSAFRMRSRSKDCPHGSFQEKALPRGTVKSGKAVDCTTLP